MIVNTRLVGPSHGQLKDPSTPTWTIPRRREMRQWRKRAKAAFSKIQEIEAIPWDEDTTEFAKELVIDAGTFSVEPIFDVLPARLEQLGDSDRFLVSPKETFAYQNRVLPVCKALDLHGHGIAAFTDEVVLPTLIDLKRDTKGNYFDDSIDISSRVFHGNVWMSMTPNEMISQRDGIKAAKGRVVVGGLGLGWFVRKVCEKVDVTEVVVVEYSQELLDWYGYELCATHPKVTSVVCGDVYDQIGKHGEDAVYCLDIWPTQSGANYDPQFLEAKKMLGDRLWGWGYNEAAVEE